MTIYPEIFKWIDDNIELDLSRSSQQNFDDISEIFEKDNRLPLADILGSDAGELLERIEFKIKRDIRLGEEARDIEQQVQEERPRSIIGRISNFLRGLFR